jgi:hypothetical protein
MRYSFNIAGVDLNPTVPPEAVSVSGGGREVRETTSVTGVIIRTLGPLQARRVRVTSPDAGWVLSEAQVAHLASLSRSGTPFVVTLGPGYEAAGTFTGVTFDGDVRFTPKRAADWVAYDFTLYLPQEAPS